MDFPQTSSIKLGTRLDLVSDDGERFFVLQNASCQYTYNEICPNRICFGLVKNMFCIRYNTI